MKYNKKNFTNIIRLWNATFLLFHFVFQMAAKKQTIGEFMASELVATEEKGTVDYVKVGAKGARLIYSTKAVANSVDFLHDVMDLGLVAYGHRDPEYLVESVSVDCALFVDKYTLRIHSGDVNATIDAASKPDAVQINGLQ